MAAIETPGTMTQLPHSEHAQYKPSLQVAVTRTQRLRPKFRRFKLHIHPRNDFSDLALFYYTLQDKRLIS